MRCLIPLILLLLTPMHASPQSQQPAWNQVLNGYVHFISYSAEEAERRLKLIKPYYEAAEYYREKRSYPPQLTPSGTLNEFYYNTARKDNVRLTAAEIETLQTGAERVWQVLNDLDEKCKELEIYVRLKDYQQDGLRQSDALLQDLAGLNEKLGQSHESLWQQIEKVYGHYHPATSADPGLQLALTMRKVLESEKELLGSWRVYLNENVPSAWPGERVEQNIIESEKAMALFAQVPQEIQYPASSAVKGFQSSMGELLQLKRNALDEYNFKARQSGQHGNAVYLQLLNYLNNALLANYASFVQHSVPAYKLLAFPKMTPRFAVAPAPDQVKTPRAKPFRDAPLLPFTVRPAAAPIAALTLQSLNNYIAFINESLRQISTWQVLLRNYGQDATYYRNAPVARKRNGLVYAHSEVKLPHSFYGQVVSGSAAIPAAYRTSVQSQAEVLMNMLKEMDALSVELIGYTQEKRYLEDELKRSDEILDRYRYLIGLFDDRKEQLYRDIRRIYESYPPVSETNSWYGAGHALLHALDLDKAVLFGVRDYLKGQQKELPDVKPLEAEGRKLLKDEYKNMKGLTRLGRNNGNCPYTYYEDIAENSVRLARKVAEPIQDPNPFESFYYFYNNQLIHEYNRFVELAQPGQLKNITQLNLFVLSPSSVQLPAGRSVNAPVASVPNYRDTPKKLDKPEQTWREPAPAEPKPTPEKTVEVKQDTVVIERVDTVYIERGGATPVRSLEGYADNNLVLLLDVSSSMNGPNKLPLLKKSVKTLLQLLRPTDRITIVVYSGKAKVALEAASGAEIEKIAQAIDALHSDGGTDGNDGIRLAYKMANRHYIRGGNNRIVLATDGEFPVSREVHEVVEANAREDVFLTVFHFTPHVPQAGNTLQQLSAKGRGSYVRITPENADRQLLTEAQAKQAR